MDTPTAPTATEPAHRRAWWRPWRCRCGRRWFCGAWDIARTQAGRRHAREVVEWYPVYFAARPPAPPTPPPPRAVGRAEVPTPEPPARVRPYIGVRGNQAWWT
jgi:hypothetical protein